jgi:dual-specificity kinase
MCVRAAPRALLAFAHASLRCAVLHDRQLVHTDLKPENILLLANGYDKEPVAPGSKHTTRVPVSSAIRLIDFGSATWETQYHSSVVSTRHYRAPEVILGMPWSYPCDSWSVGCILIELLTVRLAWPDAPPPHRR